MLKVADILEDFQNAVYSKLGLEKDPVIRKE